MVATTNFLSYNHYKHTDCFTVFVMFMILQSYLWTTVHTLVPGIGRPFVDGRPILHVDS